MPRREQPFGDMAQRQVREDDVVGAGEATARIAVGAVDDALDAVREVGVGEHGALRRPSSARRVDEGDDVVGPGGGHPLFHGMGLHRPVLASEGQELVPTEETPVLVVAQAARLEVEDASQRGELGAFHRKHLVDLFLILGEVHAGAAVGQRVEIEHQPFGPVLTMDADALADVDTECEQTVGRVEGEVPERRPVELTPNAKVLVTQGHLPRCAGRPFAGERRDCRRLRRRISGSPRPLDIDDHCRPPLSVALSVQQRVTSVLAKATPESVARTLGLLY